MGIWKKSGKRLELDWRQEFSLFWPISAAARNFFTNTGERPLGWRHLDWRHLGWALQFSVPLQVGAKKNPEPF
jgi:hypothetical protein